MSVHERTSNETVDLNLAEFQDLDTHILSVVLATLWSMSSTIVFRHRDVNNFGLQIRRYCLFQTTLKIQLFIKRRKVSSSDNSYGFKNVEFAGYRHK
jgi:hypothetical protein